MKIAFPLVNERELAEDFVHSQFIGIYDDIADKTDVLPMKGIEKDLGISAFFDMMSSQGLHCVASPFFSFMSLRVFKENNIETFKARGNTLTENISKFKENSLMPFSPFEAMMAGGGCTTNCSSCSSTMCSTQ